MIVQMDDLEIKTIEDIEIFLEGSVSFKFCVPQKKASYAWIEQNLKKFKYGKKLSKKKKGLIKKYIEKMTGYSRAQTTRLVKRYAKTGHVRLILHKRHTFSTVYTQSDIQLLAKMDKLHQNPNGFALKHLCFRQYTFFGKTEYKRIKDISVAHIYNLRNTTAYQRINKSYTKTKPSVKNTLGQRCKPQPNGKPGFLRVDTVHQGDRDKEKGVYHINTIDEETQFEFVGSCAYISEQYLMPLLEKLLKMYPFKIIAFHADNGSEYINRMVVKLLNKLLIRLTKSRSRQSTDNALVEGKNGSIIRKWIGYSFIGKQYADALNRFYFSYFNEYLNYHRPCAFPKEIIDHRGKIKKIYPYENYMTPYQKLISLDNYQQYLRKPYTPEIIAAIANRMDDNQCVQKALEHRDLLWKEINSDYDAS